MRLATLVAGIVVIAAGVAHADHDELAKKDRERALKAPRRGAPPRPGTKPAKLINLHNAWTDEWLAIEPARPPAPDTIDRFLRDHYTNQPAKMDRRLLGIVTSAATHFRSDVVIVISAFRHAKYNLILRKKGHQVARNSAHTKGHAVDFYIPRVPTTVLHAWAKAQGIGGVGLYRGSGFIHMDTDAVRYWDGE